MSERHLEIRVGLFTIIGLLILVVLILMFGNLPRFFESTYPLYIHFSDAPGVQEGTPVRKSGLGIGQVTRVEFDEEEGGVLVTVAINSRFRLRQGDVPQIEVSGFLGDVNIDFRPGDRHQPEVAPGARLTGRLPAQANQALQEIYEVGTRINEWLGPKGATLTRLSDQLVALLKEAEAGIRDARVIVGNPDNQRHVQQTLANLSAISDQLKGKLPDIVGNIDTVAEQLSRTLQATEKTFQTLERTAGDINVQGQATMKKLADAFDNASDLFANLNTMIRDFQRAEGTLQRIMTDPALYNQLLETAQSLHVLLNELTQVSRYLKEFASKIAERPSRLIGSISVFGGGTREEPEPAGKK